MSIDNALAQWDATIHAQENRPKQKYSGLVRAVESVFNIAKENNSNKYLAIFLNTHSEQPEYLIIPKATWPWGLIEGQMNLSHDNLHLMMGFDLEMSFDKQFPESLAQAEVWDYFTMQPLIWFPDHNGEIPALERQRAVEEALAPPKPKLVALNFSN